METLTPVRAHRTRWIGYAVLAAFLLTGPHNVARVVSGLTGLITFPITRSTSFVDNNFEIFNVELLLIYIIGVIGLNLLVQTGMLSIGHSALFAFGAYFVGVTTVSHGWSFWLALPVAGLLAGLSGLVLGIPALRLGHFTLAMVTVGYAFVAQDLANTLTSVTGGGDGLGGVVMPAPFDTITSYYWVVLVGAVLAFVVAHNLLRSPFGRASKAVEQSGVAARSLGVNVYSVKLRTFAISSVFAGLAGGLYAPLLNVVAPDAFDANLSILLLLMVLLGGPGSVVGPLIGAVLLFRIPIEVDRVTSHPGDWSLLVYGGVLLLSVYLVPRGLMSGWWWLSARVRRRSASPRTERARVDVAAVITPVDGEASEPVLQARGVVKRIGGLTILDGVDIAVRPGTVHGLIGPNGSGKTTLLNVLCGYVQPDAADLRVGGRRPAPGRPDLRARRGLGRTFQTPTLFEGVSCVENVLIALDAHRRHSLLASVLRLPGAWREERQHHERAIRLLQSVGLGERVADAAGGLPPGERRLLEVARVLALDPRVVLMDEPAAGLSGTEIEELSDVISHLRAAGIGVLLVEHHVDFVMGLADELTVIDFGRVIARGAPQEVRNDPVVIAAYLGTDDRADAEPVHSPPLAAPLETVG